MRNSFEATARLREASARRTEFENKVGRGRRVRFDMRLQVCGWNLNTFTVPWEDDPDGGRVATSKWKKAVEQERARVPPIRLGLDRPTITSARHLPVQQHGVLGLEASETSGRHGRQHKLAPRLIYVMQLTPATPPRTLTRPSSRRHAYVTLTPPFDNARVSSVVSRPPS